MNAVGISQCVRCTAGRIANGCIMPLAGPRLRLSDTETRVPFPPVILCPNYLTLWRRNYFFFNFSTPCVQNVNNTGTKQVSIMKQAAF